MSGAEVGLLMLVAGAVSVGCAAAVASIGPGWGKAGVAVGLAVLGLLSFVVSLTQAVSS